jgi:hypothetical protein
MTLREFLLQNAPRDEIRRRRACEEWIASVDRLLKQLHDWLTEADTASLLDLETLELDKREQGLGSYRIKGLAIHFGANTVNVMPVGRNVLAHLGLHAEPGHEKAEGRVDITNGADKYYLYRKLNDAGAEQWLIQDERAGLRPFDREQFEIILQALLS